jgi:hypothetical protein
VLSNLLILMLVLILLSVGAFFTLQYGIEQRQLAISLASTTNAITAATRTAVAQSTAAAVVNTTVPAPTAAAGVLGTAQITAVGNLRNQPLIADDSVLGLLCPGDQVALLEERTVENARWFRIRVSSVGESCSPQRAGSGMEGWANELILNRSNP